MPALSPAERQRRRRARVRKGKRCVLVEVDAAVIEDGLLTRRFLRPEDVDDPKAVAEALQAAIAALIIPPVEPYGAVTRDYADFETVK